MKSFPPITPVTGDVGEAERPPELPAQVSWMAVPQRHDFPAAASYLSLLAGSGQVAGMVRRLRASKIEHFKAKDILRAAGLDLLPMTNPHVVSNLRKIAEGVPLSPCLLIRGDASLGLPALIADGYHRVCASYHTDENTLIPVQIAKRT